MKSADSFLICRKSFAFKLSSGIAGSGATCLVITLNCQCDLSTSSCNPQSSVRPITSATRTTFDGRRFCNCSGPHSGMLPMVESTRRAGWVSSVRAYVLPSGLMPPVAEPCPGADLPPSVWAINAVGSRGSSSFQRLSPETDGGVHFICRCLSALETRLKASSAPAHAKGIYAPFSHHLDVRPRKAERFRRPFASLSRFGKNRRTAWLTSTLTCRELCACAYCYHSGICRTHPAATGHSAA
jgi:hypothetical protein